MGEREEKWIREVQKGSRKAFDKLVKKYAPLVFHLAYDLMGNREDAQDMTQETFLRAFLNIHQYRGEARFSTWLYRVAYNIGMDIKRKQKRSSIVETPLKEPGVHFPDIPQRSFEGYTGEREAIEKALQTLSDSQRVAITLNYFHGFRMREIGEVLGCSEATVRTHIFRGLRRLRRELRDYSPENES